MKNQYIVILYNEKYLVVLRQWNEISPNLSIINHYGSFDTEDTANKFCSLMNKNYELKIELAKAREVLIGLGDKSLEASSHIVEVLAI